MTILAARYFHLLSLNHSLIPLSSFGCWFQITSYFNVIRRYGSVSTVNRQSYVTAASVCLFDESLRWKSRRPSPFRECFSWNYFHFASATREPEESIPKRFEIISRVCAHRRNYPSITVSSAYTLSRCRVDFDPTHQPGYENSYQQVVTDLAVLWASGENRSKSCYNTRTVLFINSWISN